MPKSNKATQYALGGFIIYRASQLTSIAGQIITGTFFYRKTASGAMAGSPSFKIYLKETSASDWGDFFLGWSTAISGATLVYNSNPATAFGTNAGWKTLRVQLISSIQVHKISP